LVICPTIPDMIYMSGMVCKFGGEHRQC